MVNGPCQCTHLHCRRADADIAAPPADWLPIFTSLSMWELYAPWHVATDVPSGLGAAQLTRTTSRGLARSRTPPSATMARPTEFVSWPVRERVITSEKLGVTRRRRVTYAYEALPLGPLPDAVSHASIAPPVLLRGLFGAGASVCALPSGAPPPPAPRSPSAALGAAAGSCAAGGGGAAAAGGGCSGTMRPTVPSGKLVRHA